VLLKLKSKEEKLAAFPILQVSASYPSNFCIPVPLLSYLLIAMFPHSICSPHMLTLSSHWSLLTSSRSPHTHSLLTLAFSLLTHSHTLSPNTLFSHSRSPIFLFVPFFNLQDTNLEVESGSQTQKTWMPLNSPKNYLAIPK
jgi:hypothetical protein